MSAMMTKLLALLLLFAVAAPAPSATSTQQAAANEGRNAPVSAGGVAPDFTLEDQGGRKLILSAERGKRPVVLVFYRGYW